ncbi:ABC transporter permease [Aliifodinibius sp. S!AR15-10]|uniref:ABC transporter permease n=1 Tax=Aliifodinibius sp. S!AR15-10 TaxID=2950437 RepID=UPI00285960A8|nr:ABC transporter permease [Aliifodinibius sp. S!AR15-10]MDR8393447.1 ABC transporter permease [Aliifodinibius sp. S!AR15-10]
MLKNYLKIAFRNLAKEKGYTAINVVSLAIGVSVFLFTLLLYQYAITYDSFHKNGDRMYRVIDRIQTSDGNEVTTAMTPWPWAPALEEELPGVEESVRFLTRGRAISHGEDVFNFGISYVDSTFFEVFELPLKKGDPETALDGPGKVVVSPETAKIMFGNEDPVGKVIEIEDEPFEITGLFKKLPPNTSIYYDMLVINTGIDQSDLATINDWESHDIYTYLLLEEGVDPASVEAGLSSFVERHIDAESGEKYAPRLQPFTEMYLTTGIQGEHGLTLNPAYIYIIVSIGFLILVISCINFINIATARASKRNREVGIRKVIGASRPQLVYQYLFEVGILVLITVALSTVLVEWALPVFNSLTAEWQVQINYSENLFFWGSITAIILFVTFVAGGYPAFYLSKFQPARIFKSKSSGSTRSWLRSGLVVSQFTLAVFLLLCSLVVNQQIDYLHQKDLGFNKENLIRMYMSEEISYNDAHSYREELLRNPQIRSVSLASDGPISNGTMVKYATAGDAKGRREMVMNTLFTDDHFIPLMELEMRKGRNFDANLASDSTEAVILNQTAVDQLGWKDESPVGNILEVQEGDGNVREVAVIGVMSDYNYQSLQQQIKPLALQYSPEKLSNLLIRVQAPDQEKVNEYLNNSWKEYFPDRFTHFYYISDIIIETYLVEAVISQLLTMFTWLTIFVAGLGLLGLASYTILQRTKEIGIRKVLGARTREIVCMFSKEFLAYVALGIGIGIPLGWYAVNLWLQNFAYHTNLGLESILIVIAATLLISWGTIAWQAIRAALMNPVKSLRNE